MSQDTSILEYGSLSLQSIEPAQSLLEQRYQRYVDYHTRKLNLADAGIRYSENTWDPVKFGELGLLGQNSTKFYSAKIDRFTTLSTQQRERGKLC